MTQKPFFVGAISCDSFLGEVPVMVDSARKELECPICMEVMMPPARIWQCKVASLIHLPLLFEPTNMI